MEPRITSPAQDTSLAIEAIIWIGLLLAGGAFFWWLFRKLYGATEDNRSEPPPAVDRPEMNWSDLEQRAELVVEKTISGLPPELKSRAGTVPCILKHWPAEEDEGMLGQFRGFEEDRISDDGAVIFLYLGSIQMEAEELGHTFEDEVRTTYLHEFGHYLGLDEDGLEERGLA